MPPVRLSERCTVVTVGVVLGITEAEDVVVVVVVDVDVEANVIVINANKCVTTNKQ